MTTEQWSAVNRIFHDVADLPPQERTHTIEAESGGDMTVQIAVKELLLADVCDHPLLDKPAATEDKVQQLIFGIQSSNLLEAGDLLCDRFQIVRLIGEGGMGQVYEAFDRELKVKIALKVIRPEIALEEGVVRRFRHEVRLARSITHSNVCRTFDLERGHVQRSPTHGSIDIDQPGSQPFIFLTMEYVPGETLASYLDRRGALPIDEALHIAEQIAAGIAAAHVYGVIHRDLKPHNVLLARSTSSGVESLRVVLTDFGLAHLDASSLAPTDRNQSSSSRQSQTAGTLAYMAPEQIAGGPVTSAADIYSFGLILFEMVGGRRAFPAESFLQDLGARFGAEPPSPRAVNPSVSPAWDAAIRRCLAQKPEDRFVTPGEAVAALRGISPAQRNALLYVPKTLSLSWISRLLAGIAIAVVLMSSFVLIYRYTGTEKSISKVDPGALVYMPAIRNKTANLRLNDVGQMMAASLTQSSRFNLLDQSKEADVLQRMTRPVASVLDDATAREVAMRAGAVRVVLVTLSNDANLLRLNVEVQQLEPNTPYKARSHSERSWTCSRADISEPGAIPPDLLHIVRDASDWVRQIVGEAKEDIATLNLPVEDLTTMNWEALSEYAKAERLRRQDKSGDAVLALQNAIHSDPQFALAWARMGDILFSVERGAEGIKAYRQAIDVADQRRLTLLERDRLRGLIAIDTWDYPTAEAMFHDATMNYEHDYLSWFYRGSVMIQLDRLPEAISTLKKTWEIRPESVSAPITLASAYFIAQDRKSALAIASSERAKGHLPDALWLEAEDDWLQGHSEEAGRKLEQIDLKSDLRSLALGLRVRIAAEGGKPDNALQLLEQGIAEDRSTGAISQMARKKMDRAYLECEVRKYDVCLDDLRKSLNGSPDPENFREASEVLSRAVLNRPPAGVMRKIQAEFTHAIDTSPGPDFELSAEIIQSQLRADLLLSQGKIDAAVQLYRKIANKDSPIGSSFRLGHALARAAKIEENPEHKRSLASEATQSNSSIEKMRPYLWFFSRRFPPWAYP